MSLAILFHFLCSQHVSDINISIIRSLQLFCWITTLVVLFLVRCVLEFRCGWVGVVRGVYRVLVGKPEGRRPLGRPRCRWVDNIRMDLQEVGCEYMDWIGLAQDRDRWWTLVSAVLNLRVPWNAGNFLTSCKPVSFSRRTLHHGVSKQVGLELYPCCRLKHMLST